MAETSKPRPSLKARLVVAIFRLLAFLPLPLAKALLAPIGWLQTLMQSRSRRVIEQNLAYCNTSFSDSDKQRISKANLKYNARLLAETAHIWCRNYQASKRMITKVHGREQLETLMKGEQGILLISPHLGNWELVWAWVSNELNSSGLYRPPRIPELETMLLSGRGGDAIRTDNAGVRKILKLLKSGGMLFSLPDQQPPEGSGVFANFFGRPAYTMTLLHGLASKTNAVVWSVTCVLVDNQYELFIEPLPIDNSLTAEAFCEQMNNAMEQLILRNPEQYQWSYKRFKKTPDGSVSIYNREKI